MPKNELKNTVFYSKSKAYKFDFTAEEISSDGGVLLAEKVERKHAVLQSFASLLPDDRDPRYITYTREEQLKQRVFLMMQGYEDCNDQEKLKGDPLIKEVQGNDLCSQPTMSRLENAVGKSDIFRLCHWFVDRYISSIDPSRESIVIDIDSTDDPTHGQQVLSLFNGFYYQWMYNELVINDGETGQVILPVLRPGNSHSGRWAVAILRRIVSKIQEAFPGLKIIIRADSGFSSAPLYKFCGEAGIEFGVGIASNQKLRKFTDEKEAEIRKEYLDQNKKHKEIVGPFIYQADSWEKPEKVYAKVESTGKGMNIRYFVSNLENMDGEQIYWDFYVKRGDTSENRIKEVKNMCYSDRLSCHSFWANFLRFMESCLCYEMFRLIKNMIAQTSFTEAKKWQAGSIRVNLLKVGAAVKQRVRSVTVQFSKAFAYQKLLNELLLL